MSEGTSRRKYRILDINGGSWIFLNCDEEDLDTPDAFIELVKRAQKILGGKIINLGETRYRIENDNFDLIFQWDSCFGMVVEVPSNSSYEKAVQFLKSICD